MVLKQSGTRLPHPDHHHSQLTRPRTYKEANVTRVSELHGVKWSQRKSLHRAPTAQVNMWSQLTRKFNRNQRRNRALRAA
mmetsp:Transcript_23039/g.59252  ORF Transcript_23039/g.59252 Transcript_23039/m.59252 type:complete len:80 (+) Transcript_23039:617-856(+)